MKEVIVIGGGPAGVSAALYTVRAGHATHVIYRDTGALGRAELIENYYGLEEPISGSELHRRATEGARRLGVRFTEAEVTALAITSDGRYRISTKGKEYFADGVILATGAERKLPKLPGVNELFGAGVSTCAVCDSFAARRRAVAVLGAGELALHEAEALLGVAEHITILTNGTPACADSRFAYDTAEVAAIEGDTKVEAVRFRDGPRLEVSMVFVALGVAGAARLASSLGLMTEDGRLQTDERMATPLPRLYAAGDCTGGLLQIATAVAEGARAGAELSAELKRG